MVGNSSYRLHFNSWSTVSFHALSEIFKIGQMPHGIHQKDEIFQIWGVYGVTEDIDVPNVLFAGPMRCQKRRQHKKVFMCVLIRFAEKFLNKIKSPKPTAETGQLLHWQLRVIGMAEDDRLLVRCLPMDVEFVRCINLKAF